MHLHRLLKRASVWASSISGTMKILDFGIFIFIWKAMVWNREIQIFSVFSCTIEKLATGNFRAPANFSQKLEKNGTLNISPNCGSTNHRNLLLNIPKDRELKTELYMVFQFISIASVEKFSMTILSKDVTILHFMTLFFSVVRLGFLSNSAGPRWISDMLYSF